MIVWQSSCSAEGVSLRADPSVGGRRSDGVQLGQRGLLLTDAAQLQKAPARVERRGSAALRWTLLCGQS